MEPSKPELVCPELLGILQRHQRAAQTASAVFQQTINATFEQLGLSSTDQINLETGMITRAATHHVNTSKED